MSASGNTQCHPERREGSALPDRSGQSRSLAALEMTARVRCARDDSTRSLCSRWHHSSAASGMTAGCRRAYSRTSRRSRENRVMNWAAAFDGGRQQARGQRAGRHAGRRPERAPLAADRLQVAQRERGCGRGEHQPLGLCPGAEGGGAGPGRVAQHQLRAARARLQRQPQVVAPAQPVARRHDADPGQGAGRGLEKRCLRRAAGLQHGVAPRRHAAEHVAQQLRGQAVVVGGLDALVDAFLDLTHGAQRAREHQHQQRQQSQRDQHLDQGEAAQKHAPTLHRCACCAAPRGGSRHLGAARRWRALAPTLHRCACCAGLAGRGAVGARAPSRCPSLRRQAWSRGAQPRGGSRHLGAARRWRAPPLTRTGCACVGVGNAAHRMVPPAGGRRSGRRLVSSNWRWPAPSLQCTATVISCRRVTCGAALPVGVG